MGIRLNKGLEDVPIPCYLDLDGVSAKELNIGIGVLKERNDEAPGLRTFLNFEKFGL